MFYRSLLVKNAVGFFFFLKVFERLAHLGKLLDRGAVSSAESLSAAV